MSSETQLCSRCQAILAPSPHPPSKLRAPEYTVKSNPDVRTGRQYFDEDTGIWWIEVGGMVHELIWEDDKADMTALAQSAAENCYICVIMWRRYSKYTNYGSNYFPRVERIGYSLKSDFEDMFTLRIEVHGAQESCVGLLGGIPSTHFLFYGVLQSKIPSEPVEISLASTSRSQQSMQQARAWIENCAHNHRVCKQELPLPRLPRRLIRIESMEGEGEFSASLCQGDNLPSHTPYITLSHRWGKQEFLKLTTENMSQLENNIPMQKLSHSFRDAVFMTHHLGLHYLWIDSLCIIQDDLNDWEEECNAMCRIYKGAVCNIAASSHKGDEGRGFLQQQRERHPIVPPLVQVEWCASPIVPNNGIRGRNYIISEGDLLHDLDKDELYSRAWLLQEQLLAPRTLHCQGDQIYWECRSGVYNEVWPSGWTKSLDPWRRRYYSIIERFRISSADVLLEDKVPYVVWLEMVSHYSTRAITFATDRLPALVGIAVDTAAILNSAYECGIWQNALHNGVLYRSRGHLPSLKEDPVAQPLWGKVPSWSWAFLNTPIEFSTTRHPPDTIELCDIKVLDAIQPPVLEVRGPLIRMDWARTSSDRVECQAFWRPGWDDPEFQRFAEKDGVWQIYTQEDHWFAQYCHAKGQPYFDALFNEVYFVPVLYEDKTKWRKIRCFTQRGAYSRIIGLLLSADFEKGRGTFRRVGTAEFMTRKSSDHPLEMFKDIAPTYQSRIRDEDFRETDRKGSYTIWVV